MSLTSALNSAVSGLNTAQARIAVTSSNISNVNTIGYSRKISQQETITLNGTGAGSTVSSISRNIDEGLMKTLRAEMADAGRTEVRLNFYQNLQQMFGSPESNSAISQRISELANAMDQVATSPEQNAPKIEVVEAAEQVVKSFATMSDRLQSLRAEADDQIGADVRRANQLLSEIGQLNSSIVQLKNLGQATADLLDKRDNALTELSKIMNINSFTRGDGSIVVMTGTGNRVLLDRNVEQLTFNETSSFSAGYGGDGLSLNGEDITDELKSGTLRALFDMRDTELPEMQDQINELAQNLRNELNAIHNKGTAFPPPANLSGTRLVNLGDTISAAGPSNTVRIAALNADGSLAAGASYLDLDLAGLTPPTVNEIINQINSAPGLAGRVQARLEPSPSGKLIIEGIGENKVAINEMDSAIDVNGIETRGFSHYFGLNDFFASDETGATLYSSPVSNPDAALSVAGTLTINGVNVPYTTSDSMADLAATINAIPGLSATVMEDGSRGRLKITSDSGANISYSDTGSLVSKLGLSENSPSTALGLTVNSSISDDPGRIIRGTMNASSYASSTGQATGTDAITGLTGGDLVLRGEFGSTTAVTLTYPAGASLDDIANLINNNATLTAANVTAEVRFDSGVGGYVLMINDSNKDSLGLEDAGGGNLITAINLDITTGLSSGDNSAALAMADLFDSDGIDFDAAGGLPNQKTSFTGYAAYLISTNSAKASTAKSQADFSATQTADLNNRLQNIAGVNLDEEMSDLIILQRAYSASAKVFTTVDELFDSLMNVI